MDTFLHDFAFQPGGAEQVFASLIQASPVPDPDAYVIGGDRRVLTREFGYAEPRALYPLISTNLRARLSVPLLAAALPRRRPLESRVTVSSYGVARWHRTVRERLIYLHSPMRQIWHGAAMYQIAPGAQAQALRLLAPRLREIDRSTVAEGDLVAVPSQRIAKIAAEVYRTPVEVVIPPPVDDDVFGTPLLDGPRRDYVWAGRVVEPVKRLSLLLRAFEAMPERNLDIVGEGRSLVALKRIAPPNVRFLGWQSRTELATTISEAQALLLPSMEDFGMVGAEALAVGTPVIATSEAGIAEWIVEGHSGRTLSTDVSDWIDSLRQLDRRDFDDQRKLRGYAAPFRSEEFRAAIRRAWETLGWNQ